MKRDPRLIEFSREHHSALKLGLFLRNSQDVDECNTHIQALKTMLLEHFNEEEKDLLNIIDVLPNPSLRERFISDHQALRSLLIQDHLHLHDAKIFGELLVDHSRFEERKLFPAIQQYWRNDHDE